MSSSTTEKKWNKKKTGGVLLLLVVIILLIIYKENISCFFLCKNGTCTDGNCVCKANYTGIYCKTHDPLTTQGVTGTIKGVTGTIKGVTGTIKGVTGTSQGVTGTSQGVTGTSQAPLTKNIIFTYTRSDVTKVPLSNNGQRYSSKFSYIAFKAATPFKLEKFNMETHLLRNNSTDTSDLTRSLELYSYIDKDGPSNFSMWTKINNWVFDITNTESVNSFYEFKDNVQLEAGCYVFGVRLVPGGDYIFNHPSTITSNFSNIEIDKRNDDENKKFPGYLTISI